MTKEVEVEYLLQRLEPADTPEQPQSLGSRVRRVLIHCFRSIRLKPGTQKD